MRTIAIDSGVLSATLLFAVCAIYRSHANPSDTAPTSQETKTTRNGDFCKPRGELTADLLRHKIIPDFIDDVPSIVCTVEWVEGHFADLGNLIPNDVADFHPYWVDYRGNETEWLTLIIAGLDEPSYKEPILREYLHWLVVNVPGNNYHKGQELAFYKGPEPAKGTGIHRHGIVVYKQPEKLTFTEKRIKSPYSDNRRANFSSRHFAEKYHFGDPIAVNFFQTEWTPKPTLPSSLPRTLFPRTSRSK